MWVGECVRVIMGKKGNLKKMKLAHPLAAFLGTLSWNFEKKVNCNFSDYEER